MCVILDKYSFFYAAAPKVACTSLKLAFFELENGFPFRIYTTNGSEKYIHNAYPTRLRADFPDQRIKNYFRTTFVREPIARFLSAYSNRVIHHQELSIAKAKNGLEQHGLEATPDLDVFIDRLSDYKKAHSSIRHHTRPLVMFLGDDADYYNKIYTPADMAQFASDMSERTGTDFTVGRAQTGGPKFSPDDLTQKQRDKLLKIYEADYRAFGKYF